MVLADEIAEPSARMFAAQQTAIPRIPVEASLVCQINIAQHRYLRPHRTRSPARKDIVMGIVMIRCPRTGREISTGIKMSRTDFKRSPVFFARTYCPICSCEHEWFAKDAWVCERARTEPVVLADS
jgi:hypothetical protein